jgi:hypothetical protein
MRRKPYFAPIFMLVLGVSVLANVAGRPSFQTYRTVDVLSLIAVGMLFGVAITSTAFILRGNRVP